MYRKPPARPDRSRVTPARNTSVGPVAPPAMAKPAMVGKSAAPVRGSKTPPLAAKAVAVAPPAKPASGDKPEPKILWQSFFKSIGPRTYAAQLKELHNGNHLLVLTEGKRDEETDEVRKTRLFVYAEDFPAFFKMLQETVGAIKANPLTDETRRRRAKYWAKKNGGKGRDRD